MADRVTGRTRVHRERVERVHQRCDAETHVEPRCPRKRGIGEDREDAESPAIPCRNAGHGGLGVWIYPIGTELRNIEAERRADVTLAIRPGTGLSRA